MSAETLRRAAVAIRDEWGGRGDPGTAWHRVVAFHLAVADWLDKTATKYEAVRDGFSPHSHVGDEVAASNTLAFDEALAVATAYLGEQPC